MRKIFCDLCRKEILPTEKKVRISIGNNTGMDPAETTWEDVCLDCADFLRHTAQGIWRKKEEDRQLVSDCMSGGNRYNAAGGGGQSNRSGGGVNGW